MIKNFLYCIFIWLVCPFSTIAHNDKFYEELLLKPLLTNQLYAYFQFTTVWNTESNSNAYQHCHLFPRSLGEIVGRYDIEELHISLTGGLWRYESWGYPVIDAAPGVELWAWFKPGTPNIDKQWKELANSLSGLLCASLNFIDPSNSVSPQYSFRPTGISKDKSVNCTYLRYSALPREVVCTENLTPWKKLLPCDSKKGLASLLNSGYIHNTRYHSLGLHLRTICSDSYCNSTNLELKQTVSLVYDFLILDTKNWALPKLFGQGLIERCSLADTSYIYVDITSNKTTPFNLLPVPVDIVKSIRGGDETTFARYNVNGPHSNILNIAASYILNQVVPVKYPPVLHANQYIAGFGQEFGLVITKIYNNYYQSLNIVLLQNLPWYVPVYLHTLKIKSNGVDLKPVHTKFIPGKERVRPYYLELLLKLPPKSETVVSIDFDYVFLKWQEYPPDANHGFYIGSSAITSYLPVAKNYTGLPLNGSLISSSLNASRLAYLVQIRTESMLITLPTPDFSMPYNVICLACTVVALAFGPLHNITTKRLVLKVPKKTNFMQKLKEYVYWFKKEKTE